MKKHLFIWGGVLIILLLSIYVTSQHRIDEPEIALSSPLDPDASQGSETEGAGEREGDANNASAAIDFTLPDLDGNLVSLQELIGKPVYINFWATWCKWCIQEMPDMETVFQEYEDQDLVILAIAVGEDEPKVKQYLSDKPYSFHFLLDADKHVTRAYGLKSIPVSIFIDRQGHVVYKRVGAMNEEQIRSVIGQMFGQTSSDSGTVG